MNMLIKNPTELCILKGKILCCVNYISLKLLLQNFKQNIHRREEKDQSIIVRNVNTLLIIEDRKCVQNFSMDIEELNNFINQFKLLTFMELHQRIIEITLFQTLKEQSPRSPR